MRRSRRLGTMMVATCLLSMTLAQTAGAAWPNLISNGEFDFDEIPWQAHDGDASLVWSSVDHTGCGDLSGSLLATNSSASPLDQRNFTMCFGGILPGATYSFGADLRFPSSQTRTGTAKMHLVWSDDLNCAGSVLSVVAAFPSRSTTESGVWLPVAQHSAVAPAGAVGAELRIVLEKNEAGGDLEVRFDGVYFARAPGYLFADDFGVESFCRWSAELP